MHGVIIDVSMTDLRMHALYVNIASQNKKSTHYVLYRSFLALNYTGRGTLILGEGA
jgi:hypothetical protein